MKNSEAARWFKTNFQKKLETALQGTPFTVDLLTAIALQETGYLWRRMIERGKLSVPEILEACVGDTIGDSGGRTAFPMDKAQLRGAKDGDKMFKVARESLEKVAPYDEAYDKALKNPEKFCRGYGIFQYDLQFFVGNNADPAYFLNKKWADFDACVAKALGELKSKLVRVYGNNKNTLTDEEQVYVAIAYNKGSADVTKGFKQGHVSDGVFYGENIDMFLRVAKSVTVATAELLDKPSAAPPTAAVVEDPRTTPFAPLADATATPPPYPGRLIKRDTANKSAVKLIQKRLRELGYTQPGDKGPEPLSADGDFGQNTENAIELFQVRHTDLTGRQLVADGQVGQLTWEALFGRPPAVIPPAGAENAVAAAVVTDALLAKALEFAVGEIGVREDPLGSNKGARVVEYQARVGIPRGGEPWCAAFVYFCFDEAAKALGVANPVVQTAGVLDHWNKARPSRKIKTINQEQALDDPSLVKPGMIFIISTGGGNGHTGLIESVSGNSLITIEGNTNDGGSREGIGVFRRSGRTIASINRGFINYGA